MQGGEGSGGGRVVVLFDKSQKSSVTVSLHIYNIGFYFKLKIYHTCIHAYLHTCILT